MTKKAPGVVGRDVVVTPEMAAHGITQSVAERHVYDLECKINHALTLLKGNYLDSEIRQALAIVVSAWGVE